MKKSMLCCAVMLGICCTVSLFSVMSLADSEPIVIQSQGSFTAGGSTLTDSGEFVFSELWSQSG
ncbi:MAG: hypothetical protein IJS39_11735 [Synergistaceae bacterium]|nr:hypothetical protein [Synergistaceae bacterium]